MKIYDLIHLRDFLILKVPKLKDTQSNSVEALVFTI